MKFKLLILFVFYIVLLPNSNFAYSQEDVMQAPLPSSPPPPPPQAIPQAGLQRLQAPPPSPGFPPTNVPPALLIRGKEFEMSRVLIENANVNKEVKIEFLMFDRDSKEKLTSKAYGLTPTAKYNIETSDTVKNSAQAVFTWTPTEKDIGTHGFAFEVSNSKDAVNRLAIFFEVKP